MRVESEALVSTDVGIVEWWSRDVGSANVHPAGKLPSRIPEFKNCERAPVGLGSFARNGPLPYSRNRSDLG